MDKDFVTHLVQLKDGVVELFDNLPTTSHMRQPLLHFIARYLPVSPAADWLHVKASTIKSARR